MSEKTQKFQSRGSVKASAECMKYQAKQSCAPESTRKNVSIDMKIEQITEEGVRTRWFELKWGNSLFPGPE